jgi:hypothetical protein
LLSQMSSAVVLEPQFQSQDSVAFHFKGHGNGVKVFVRSHLLSSDTLMGIKHKHLPTLRTTMCNKLFLGTTQCEAVDRTIYCKKLG